MRNGPGDFNALQGGVLSKVSTSDKLTFNGFNILTNYWTIGDKYHVPSDRWLISFLNASNSVINLGLGIGVRKEGYAIRCMQDYIVSFK